MAGEPYARAQSLVTAAALAELVATDTPPLVLDTRWRLGGPPAYPDYLAGHIPGAVFCDLDRDMSGPPGPRGRHPLPEPADLAATLSRWGVRPDRTVVAYDDRDSVVAARAWWTLRWAGVTDVRVLDGGYAAWIAAGQPTGAGEFAPVAGEQYPADLVGTGPVAILDAQGAARIPGAGALLDARAADRYRGEVEPIDPAAGHIPGAVSAPSAGNVDPDGRFLPAAALRDRFERLGVDPAGPVGAYCGSGVTAAHTVLALHLAGIPAALYVGSWSEWTADSTRPIAVGPEPH